MAACGSLQHIFESPTILPETPTTLLESFSLRNKIKPLKKTLSSLHHHPHDDNPSSPSFTEIFGELHFQENPNITSSQPNIEKEEEEEEVNDQKSPSKECNNNKSRSHKSSDSFSSMSSESLQLCTEGLGFESSDEVEELVKSDNINNKDEDQDEDDDDDDEEEDEDDDIQEGKVIFTRQYFPMSENNNYNNNCCGGGGGEFIRMRSSRSSVGGFPPPISCISQNGKPWVCFKSYRHDGRFVLKEIRLPTQEFLHACREDGRLKLHFVITDDESLGEDEEEDNVSDDDEDEEEEEEIEAIEGDIEAKKTNDDEVL